jgi:hypothetical protein
MEEPDDQLKNQIPQLSDIKPKRCFVTNGEKVQKLLWLEDNTLITFNNSEKFEMIDLKVGTKSLDFFLTLAE